ncbi:MAG: Lrp/AsnC ligand binding domain-containing protein [Acidobacteria bacterium]|nr:Lrp/AsnC ligand binding domain-containing protein [Acidobacteriota bacterium]
MRAYVFVNVKAGKTKEVAGRLRDLAGVTAADACWGTPDIIVAVNVKTERVLNELVLNRIQKIAGVEHTDTHITLD